MATIVQDCPRCSTKHQTFDIKGTTLLRTAPNGWQYRHEVFGVCRRCLQSTVFRTELTEYDVREIFGNGEVFGRPVDVTAWVRVFGYVSALDLAVTPPPESLPENIEAAFVEGAKCMAIQCYNAAGAMFRLAIDLSTKAMLPAEAEGAGPNNNQRRNLAPRIEWLFDNGRLPADLRRLFGSVRAFGNDGAHDGTLTDADAADLLDFARVLLERLYTEPARLAAAEQRAQARRQPNEGG